MTVIGTSQAAKLLGVSTARVRQLLATERIFGAYKIGKVWAIPFSWCALAQLRVLGSLGRGTRPGSHRYLRAKSALPKAKEVPNRDKQEVELEGRPKFISIALN